MFRVRSRPVRGLPLLLTLSLVGGLVGALQGCATSGSASASGSLESGDAQEDGANDSSSDSPMSPEARAKRRFSCPSGVCSECGAGVCPPGMFCLQTGEGEPGCSFLPHCEANDACSCIERSMGSGCTCSQQQGAVSVSCQ
jgi:hypothetical protein